MQYFSECPHLVWGLGFGSAEGDKRGRLWQTNRFLLREKEFGRRGRLDCTVFTNACVDIIMMYKSSIIMFLIIDLGHASEIFP